MTIDITEIIIALIGLVIAVLGTVLTKVVIPWIEARTSEATQSIIQTAAEAAVLFVQQTMEKDEDEKKLSAAIERAGIYLAGYGITLDSESIAAAVEGALKVLKITAGDSWQTE
ncbi:MAG: phage holin family protein [Firmicutes bacterium]|nr:phage holin family protein [Bacillota bacterium]